MSKDPKEYLKHIQDDKDHYKPQPEKTTLKQKLTAFSNKNV